MGGAPSGVPVLGLSAKPSLYEAGTLTNRLASCFVVCEDKARTCCTSRCDGGRVKARAISHFMA
eukprot:scaffold2448_cov15-Tisochrysis_lutea.AAC.1